MASSHKVKELPVNQKKESSKIETNRMANTSTSGSAHLAAHTTGGGNRSKKAKGKTLDRAEQEEFSDGSNDSQYSDPHVGTSPSPRPRIQFEIITEVGKALHETLNIAGAFTFKVCSFFFSIISMSPISVSFFGIIGATKIREKPLFHIECRILVC